MSVCSFEKNVKVPFAAKHHLKWSHTSSSTLSQLVFYLCKEAGSWKFKRLSQGYLFSHGEN